jgi:ElaB/YqjD/DUF883 family membrane-anchored ribosome-binding protein
MVEDDELARELAELRAEIEALKVARERDAKASEAVGGEAVGDLLHNAAARFGGQSPEPFQDLERAIVDLAEAVESDIAKRPIASVGAAFLLGILVGRLSAR